MGFGDPRIISVGKDHNDIKFDCILDDSFFFLDGVNYLPKAEARLHSLHVMTVSFSLCKFLHSASKFASFDRIYW